MVFFQNLKWLIEDLHENNKELVRGVRNGLKEFRTEMKDLTKQYYPKTGDAIEKMDRAVQTLKNGRRSIPVPLTTTVKRPVLRINGRFPSILTPGDHIYVKRVGYEHHALYIGNNRVVHYSNGSVRIDYIEAMDSLTNLFGIKVKDSPCLYNVQQVIERAESRIGESDYNLALNNCEHFVIWCRSGGKYSNSI